MARDLTKQEKAEQVLQDYISKLVDDKQQLTRELSAVRPRAEHFEEVAKDATAQLAAMRQRAEKAEARVEELEARYIPPPQAVPDPEPIPKYERLPDSNSTQESADA